MKPVTFGLLSSITIARGKYFDLATIVSNRALFLIGSSTFEIERSNLYKILVISLSLFSMVSIEALKVFETETSSGNLVASLSRTSII